MVSSEEVTEMIKKARESTEKKKFNQSVELIVALKDIDLKKGFSLNEVINLPNKPSKQASVCLVAAGDLALRARNAGVDRVIEPDELERIGSNKREARKLANAFDFFLADTSFMPAVGKALGQVLGPRGKMAFPVQFNAPIDAILGRFRGSVRVRVKGQLTAAGKIGNEDMSDKALVENALAVLSAIEKKLPNGERNIRSIKVKFTMGKPVKLVEAKVV